MRRRCASPVRDIDGELVAVHVTYLQHGQKLSAREPRKLPGPVIGRSGCAIRLGEASAGVLGIGEGIETCLAASRLSGIPVWSALNASLLERFEPPSHIKTLAIFADNDAVGLKAATILSKKLENRVGIDLRVPRRPWKDWNDVLTPSFSPPKRRGFSDERTTCIQTYV
jgi:putative DNA primase/helicase